MRASGPRANQSVRRSPQLGTTMRRFPPRPRGIGDRECGRDHAGAVVDGSLHDAARLTKVEAQRRATCARHPFVSQRVTAWSCVRFRSCGREDLACPPEGGRARALGHAHPDWSRASEYLQMCSQRTAKGRHLHLRLDAHAWRELLSRAASLPRVLYASPQGRRPRWCRDGATCLSALRVAGPNSSLPVRGRAAFVLSARGGFTSLGGALRGTTLSLLLCRARHGL
mmetsp:Transcript_50424/g.163363  ORF Transcript_50424/g.163363 Transcript_50424/m.163363 type:complete len:226 (-) Transcript_50424:13-690(-)